MTDVGFGRRIPRRRIKAIPLPARGPPALADSGLVGPRCPLRDPGPVHDDIPPGYIEEMHGGGYPALNPSRPADTCGAGGQGVQSEANLSCSKNLTSPDTEAPLPRGFNRLTNYLGPMPGDRATVAIAAARIAICWRKCVRLSCQPRPTSRVTG